ncbi:MAG: sortase A [Alphaproteobacteria bacterium]|jgi:sortase A
MKFLFAQQPSIKRPYIKMWGTNKIESRLLFMRAILASSILIVGIALLVNASYIQLKAQLAQVLIASAYNKQIAQQQVKKPWPWADTHVLAKLEVLGKTNYILANASMRTLAFGPAHMSQSANLGDLGNSVIVGHRDTHFSHLQNIKVGEIIRLHQGSEQTIYRVEEIKVVDETQVSVIEDLPLSALTLITCYPFNAVSPNPKQRFVVRAIRIDGYFS